MITYLASPYTHPDPAVREHRYRAVLKCAGKMMADGMRVFSPIVYSHVMSTDQNLPVDWAFWREFDLEMLSRCDELIVLRIDGWDRSVGVAAEIEFADKRGMPLVYVEPEVARHSGDSVREYFEWHETAEAAIKQEAQYAKSQRRGNGKRRRGINGVEGE